MTFLLFPNPSDIHDHITVFVLPPEDGSPFLPYTQFFKALSDMDIFASPLAFFNSNGMVVFQDSIEITLGQIERKWKRELKERELSLGRRNW